MSPGNTEDYERTIDAKLEEIQTLKTQLEMAQLDTASKLKQMDSLGEENDEFKEKAQKWKGKLDTEIEKNRKDVINLTKTIKELQDEKYKMQIATNERNSVLMKEAFKEKTDHIKRLELKLKELANEMQEHELARFQIEETLVKERSLSESRLRNLETEVQRTLSELKESKD